MLPVLLALLVAQSPSTPNDGKAARALRIGVAAVESSEPEPVLTRITEESLLVELRKLSRTSVIGMNEIRRMLDLEADKQSLGCDGANDSCLVEIADAVGVDVLVTCSLSLVGDERVFGVRRIDQREAKVASVVRRVARGDGQEVLALVGPAIAELFPELPLRPGEKRGVAAEAAQRLSPPPLPGITPFAFGALAAAGVLTTGGAALAWQLKQSEYRTIAGDDPIDGNALVSTGDDAVFFEGAMWLSMAATATCALLAGLAVPFSDVDALLAYPDETVATQSSGGAR